MYHKTSLHILSRYVKDETIKKLKWLPKTGGENREWETRVK